MLKPEKLACLADQRGPGTWVVRGLGRGPTLDRIREGRVKVVGNLGEAIGRALLAIRVKQVKLDTPFLHRKLRHGRILGTKRVKQVKSVWRVT